MYRIYLVSVVLCLGAIFFYMLNDHPVVLPIHVIEIKDSVYSCPPPKAPDSVIVKKKKRKKSGLVIIIDSSFQSAANAWYYEKQTRHMDSIELRRYNIEEQIHDSLQKRRVWIREI